MPVDDGWSEDGDSYSRIGQDDDGGLVKRLGPGYIEYLDADEIRAAFDRRDARIAELEAALDGSLREGEPCPWCGKRRDPHHAECPTAALMGWGVETP
jgi:hypothetical protein